MKMKMKNSSPKTLCAITRMILNLTRNNSNGNVPSAVGHVSIGGWNSRLGIVISESPVPLWYGDQLAEVFRRRQTVPYKSLKVMWYTGLNKEQGEYANAVTSSGNAMSFVRLSATN